MEPAEAIQKLLSNLLLSYQVQQASREIWKANVVSVYPNLTVGNIRAYTYKAREWVREGSWRLIELITCNMDYFNAVIGDEDSIECPISPQEVPGDDASEDDGAEILARDLEKRQPYPVRIAGRPWVIRPIHVSMAISCPAYQGSNDSHSVSQPRAMVARTP